MYRESIVKKCTFPEITEIELNISLDCPLCPSVCPQPVVKISVTSLAQKSCQNTGSKKRYAFVRGGAYFLCSWPLLQFFLQAFPLFARWYHRCARAHLQTPDLQAPTLRWLCRLHLFSTGSLVFWREGAIVTSREQAKHNSCKHMCHTTVASNTKQPFAVA